MTPTPKVLKTIDRVNRLNSLSRRAFLAQSFYIGLGSITVRYLHGDVANAQRSPVDEKNFGVVAAEPNTYKKQRYEGPTKVTGKKIYGIDFRAKDFQGWPVVERRAIIVRTPLANRVYQGIQKQSLIKSLGASRIITGDDLISWGCSARGPFLMPDFYVRSNTVPAYFGQPLAIVSFASADDFLQSKEKTSDLSAHMQFAATGAPKIREPYARTRLVRYLNQAGQEEASFVKDYSAAQDNKSDSYIKKIEQDTADAGWHLLQGRFSTQSVDPMFMEPEAGLSWYDSKSHTLTLTLGTQSPYDDGFAILSFFEKASTPKIKKVMINCCYPGGGFGGRDSSDFPIHLAIAALAEPDVAHRIVHTRADQFQSGIKRHASIVDLSLAVDAAGKFQMIHSDIKLDGGGQNNYSFAVQSVAAKNAAGGYHFPRSWVDSVALPSTDIPAGSMRGFGSFQSQFSLECLIDEAAAKLSVDPIELRQRNLINGLGVLLSGTQLAAPIGSDKVLAAAKRSALWLNRHALKRLKTTQSTLYGTGFALGVKTFGKAEDVALSGLTLEPDGTLTLYIHGVDMGNGCATTLPLALADILGRPADQVKIGVTSEFDALNIFGVKPKSEAEQQSLSKNPFWVPQMSMSQAASASAYQFRHAVLEAGKVLLAFGLWPAASQLLELKGDNTKFDPKSFSLNEQGLIYQDGRKVSFLEMTQRAYQLGLVTGVQVHAFYRTRWAKAAFTIGNALYTSEIDALALRFGKNAFSAIPRSEVDFPAWSLTRDNTNRMSSYALIVAVEVDKISGNIRVVDADGYLDCGPAMLPEMIQGQMQGAFAMGIGQALMENCPGGDNGPGQGGWNLHRYHVPLARDCAIGKANFHILPADMSEDPKGMAEVVLNPVPAAIVNAVADATAIRFKQLPLSAEDIKGALL